MAAKRFKIARSSTKEDEAADATKPQAPRTSPVPIIELCRDRLQTIEAALERLVDQERSHTAIAVPGDRGLGKSMMATRTLLAGSLFRIGAHAEAERITGDLIAEALEANDHAAALAAATLGLPEAEQHEGSGGRLTRLLRIDPGKLEAEDRFRHAVTTARQWMFRGHTVNAELWKQSAADQAGTPDKKAAVKNVDWYLAGGAVPQSISAPSLST